MDKNKCDHVGESSDDESTGTGMSAKRTRMGKGHQSAPSMNRLLVGSPFPSTSGRTVPGSSHNVLKRTQLPATMMFRPSRNSRNNFAEDSSTLSTGKSTCSSRPFDKRCHTEKWMKHLSQRSELRQPSSAEIRAKNSNMLMKADELIKERDVDHDDHLSDVDLQQCKRLSEILDSELMSWMREYERRPLEGGTRRNVGAESPIIGSMQPACMNRPSTSRSLSYGRSVHYLKSQPKASILPAHFNRLPHSSDSTLTTDQVELSVRSEHPLASDPLAVPVADPLGTSDDPDDRACPVSLAEDSPVRHASKGYMDSGFINRLLGTLNRIADPHDCTAEQPIVPQPLMQREVQDLSVSETPDSVATHPGDVTTESLQPGEEDALQENPSGQEPQEQEPIQPSASQVSLSDIPAELDTSASKRNANEGLNKALLSLLECPVCMEVMAPPLAQCRRGHLLCEGCRKLITSCPTCRSRFTALRNLAMEKVAEKLLYPCRHVGCAAVLPFKQRGQHEASCARRSYLCSIPHCKKLTHLQYNQLLQHYQTHHADALLSSSDNNFEIDIVNQNLQDDWLVHAHGELFHIHFGVDTDNWGINSSVTYIGPEKNARNYIYLISVEDNSRYNRRFLYQRATHSDMESRAYNYGRRDAFFIPLDGAMFLARKKKLDNNRFSDILCVTLKIKKCNHTDEWKCNEDIAIANVE